MDSVPLSLDEFARVVLSLKDYFFILLVMSVGFLHGNGRPWAGVFLAVGYALFKVLT